MHIVVSHPNTDLDALASLVAAAKLWPGAQAVRSTMLSPSVRNFLALHKDRIDSIRSDEVDVGAVTRITVVDTRSRRRLKEVEAVLRRVDAGEVALEIWDHHPAQEDDLVGPGRIEPVGACITLFIEALRERGIAPDPVEATLFALAIHADTGSLTFPSTDARDAQALSWLLGHGADLRALRFFLEQELSPEQRQVMVRMLGAMEQLDVGGLCLGTAIVELDDDVRGLADVVGRVAAMTGIDALIAFFVERSAKVQMIGRSQVRWLDMGALLSGLGRGGGHRAAASATAKGVAAEELIATLRSRLEEDPPRPRRVVDLMSSPVRCVSPETTFGELHEALESWRMTGVPVVREGRLVGMVSRRDVARAAQEGILDSAVAGRMSTHVHVIEPEATIETALERVQSHDVGRLPVLRHSEVVGIITRSDLIRHLYDGEGQGAS